jgi:hypothetical protein
LVIELVVVSMAVAVGAVYMADVWPSPDMPLIWMGGAAGAFFIYAVVAALRDVRGMLRTQTDAEATVEAGGGEVSRPQQPTAGGEVPVTKPAAIEPAAIEPAGESATGANAPEPTLRLGAPSEEATAFLALDELRPETDEDKMSSDVPSVPLFAESSMYSTADLAAGARAIEQRQEMQEMQEIEDFEEIDAIEAIDEFEDFEDLEEIEVSAIPLDEPQEEA